jgi:AraC family transcriptional regulator of adaptative response / DNA-3-methyladenine glycosylase II
MMRTFRRSPRARLDAAAELYLRRCYRLRTAARASEFAEHLGLTQPHLSRMVANVAGTSAREYLRVRQLRYAARVLRSTPLPVSEVAIATGFGTASTFNRCFVAAFGKTPAAYRAVFRS